MKRIGLGVELMPAVEGEGREEWIAGQSRREGKQRSAVRGSRTEELARTARANTIKRLDVWGIPNGATGREGYGKGRVSIALPRKMLAASNKSMGLVDYDSDDR